MRKMAGIASAMALMAAAFGIWSKTTLVTKAAGVVAGYDMGGLAASPMPAKFADRFPTESEMFRPFADRFPAEAELLRPVAFIHQTDGIERSRVIAASTKADRLPGNNSADCARLDLPQTAMACLTAVNAKPVKSAERVVTIERRTGDDTSELVRAPVAAAPIAARMAPASCRQTLATATAGLERLLVRVNGQRRSDNPDACASYRRDFFEIVKAREVTAMCKTGAERAQELGRIDLAVENINGAIAQSCGS